jgi:prepilin-type N-terminal cleavage/methylation domain-containing protein
MIMCRNRKKRAVRMLNLINPQIRMDCSYFKNNYGYGLRGSIKGFTLVELLIVVAIISIAALTAIPMMSSAAGMQIRSASNMIAADLEYAKSLAISRAQLFSVVFDVSADSYQIEDQNGNVLQHPVKKGFNYVVDFQKDGRLDKVDIISVDFDTTSEVRYDYLGSPYNGGGTPLNSGVITLQAGGTTTTVTVEPVTGFVSIQ